MVNKKKKTPPSNNSSHTSVNDKPTGTTITKDELTLFNSLGNKRYKTLKKHDQALADFITARNMILERYGYNDSEKYYIDYRNGEITEYYYLTASADDNNREKSQNEIEDFLMENSPDDDNNEEENEENDDIDRRLFVGRYIKTVDSDKDIVEIQLKKPKGKENLKLDQTSLKWVEDNKEEEQEQEIMYGVGFKKDPDTGNKLIPQNMKWDPAKEVWVEIDNEEEEEGEGEEEEEEDKTGMSE